MSGMKQKAKVMLDDAGKRTGIIMEQEISFLALGKNALLELSKVSTPYLIQELQSRGFELDLEEGSIQGIDLKVIADLCLDCMLRHKVPLITISQGIVDSAMRRTSGSQAKAADMLGLSRRALNYHVKRGGCKNVRLLEKGEEL